MLKIRQFVAMIAVLVSAVCCAKVGQPYAPYWHPQTLLQWSPETDPDAPFNRGSIPLKSRFTNPLLNVNSNARFNEGRVQILADMNPSTRNAPAQGSDIFRRNNFGFWQYVHELVYWGGSAGEGIILAPSADVIDAAHRNGVPVLGNIFFPPKAYGGQFAWVEQFLQKEGDRFPVADKLIEVAEYFGFDGWFINQETTGGGAITAANMRDLMIYIKNNSNLRVCWYDAMTESGSISWQNQLNTSNDWYFQHNNTMVSDTMFLNFWWNSTRLTNSRIHAINLGRDPYELYAGIDTEANGYFTNVNWDALFPPGQPHVLSLGIYKPNWCFRYSSSISDFYNRELRYWSGANHDPSNTVTTDAWKGISHYIPAQSVLDELPFSTTFSTGHGTHSYIAGQIRSSQEWNNRSLQDVLPTWRWMVQSAGSKLNVEFDWTDAYYFGNCLKVSGTLNAHNTIHLYQTQFTVEEDTVMRMTFKYPAGGNPRMSLLLAFEDNLDQPVFFSFPQATGTWQTASFPLADHAGRTISLISLMVDGSIPVSNYQCKLGLFQIAGPSQPPAPPTNGQLIRYFPESNTARLRWDHSPDPVHFYMVYQRLSNGTLQFLGSTPSNYYYVQSMAPVGNGYFLEVQAVDASFQGSAMTPVSPGPDFNPAMPADAMGRLGQPIQFTVSVVDPINGAMTGQWYYSSDLESPGIPLANGAKFSGVNTPTLTVNNFSFDDVGYYYAMVTNATGVAASSRRALLSRPNLVAWYAFEDNLLDSVSDHHGTPIKPNPAEPFTYVSGPSGNAIVLSGSEAVSIPNSIQDSFTIAFWVKTTVTGNTGGWWNGIGLVDGDVPGLMNDFGTAVCGGKLAFGVGPDTTIISRSSINDNQWRYCVATRDHTSGAMKVYVDGVLETSATGPTGRRDAALTLRIGKILSGTNYLNGQIDDVKLFNYALSESEVADSFYSVTGESVCVESLRPSQDLSGNCRVDLSDLMILASQWLDCGLVPDCLQ